MLHLQENLNNFSLFRNMFLENQTFLLENLGNCKTGANISKAYFSKRVEMPKGQSCARQPTEKKNKKSKAKDQTRLTRSARVKITAA